MKQLRSILSLITLVSLAMFVILAFTYGISLILPWWVTIWGAVFIISGSGYSLIVLSKMMK